MVSSSTPSLGAVRRGRPPHSGGDVHGAAGFHEPFRCEVTLGETALSLHKTATPLRKVSAPLREVVPVRPAEGGRRRGRVALGVRRRRHVAVAEPVCTVTRLGGWGTAAGILTVTPRPREPAPSRSLPAGARVRGV